LTAQWQNWHQMWEDSLIAEAQDHIHHLQRIAKQTRALHPLEARIEDFLRDQEAKDQSMDDKMNLGFGQGSRSGAFLASSRGQ